MKKTEALLFLFCFCPSISGFESLSGERSVSLPEISPFFLRLPSSDSEFASLSFRLSASLPEISPFFLRLPSPDSEFTSSSFCLSTFLPEISPFFLRFPFSPRDEDDEFPFLPSSLGPSLGRSLSDPLAVSAPLAFAEPSASFTLAVSGFFFLPFSPDLRERISPFKTVQVLPPSSEISTASKRLSISASLPVTVIVSLPERASPADKETEPKEGTELLGW
ncbi:MAG: hypothetical protein BWY75_02785 [bacterium ADurb.Bin425]|nr:MAG: hypothetical protein BWY75_02785 [bacterium ADurb.Bin425]